MHGIDMNWYLAKGKSHTIGALLCVQTLFEIDVLKSKGYLFSILYATELKLRV